MHVVMAAVRAAACVQARTLACAAAGAAAPLLLPPASTATQPPTPPTGLGLFVEGQVPPGALLALFPGLVYHKAVYR